MEDLTIYNQIAALTNYFMRKTALNDSVKYVEKMQGRHAEVELPESFAKRLKNAKAKINIASPKVRDYYYYDYNNSLFDWNNIFPTSNKDLLNGGMQL